MDIIDKSIFKWDEPKSFFEYRERKTKKTVPKWRWVLGRYIIPIFGPALIFIIFGIVIKSVKIIVMVAVLVLVSLLLPLIQKYKKKTIRLYENKLSIYEDDVRKKNLILKHKPYITLLRGKTVLTLTINPYLTTLDPAQTRKYSQ